MTTVIFRKTKNQEYIGFECDGHAGFADYGYDIVCASLSVLTINTINSLEELLGLSLNIECDEKSGHIKCTFLSSLDEKAILLMDSLVLGCTSIQSQYGKKYCKVKFKEV